MSKTTRYLGCDRCGNVKHMHQGNYLCEIKGAWIWPWLVDDNGTLPECSEFKENHDAG